MITSLTKHKVPTDFSFTEMDKLYADMKEQDLTKSINNTINTFSMLPGNLSQSVTDLIAVAGNSFTAETNGVAYIRIKGSRNGYLGFHLQNESLQDLAYNTQYLDTAYGAMYNATFVMKRGQRILCYENGAGYAWGGLYFIASQTI